LSVDLKDIMKLGLSIFMISFALVGFLPLPAGAAKLISVQSLFSADEIAALRQGKIITRAYLKESPSLNVGSRNGLRIPRSEYIGDLSNYEMVADEKAFIPYRLTDKNRLAFYNLLVSHSRLAGMKYYSRTEKKLEPFIIDSYCVDSAEGVRRTADPIYASIEKKRESYFRVRDNRFGDMVFQSDLYNEGDCFIVKNTCTAPLSKYGMSLSRAGEYQIINFLLYDREAGGFYYYAIHALRIHNGALLKSGMLSAWSFANRLRAGTVHMAQMLGVDLMDKIRVVAGKYN
jgi:hypothetical protein